MAEDVSYEVKVLKNGNWVLFGFAPTPLQAEQDGRTALAERKYLDAYMIICERRDGRTGKGNRIAFPAVLRENLDAVADQQWERHVLGKPAVDPPPKQKRPRRAYSWVVPVLLLIVIMWGAYFTLVFVRAQIFAK